MKQRTKSEIEAMIDDKLNVAFKKLKEDCLDATNIKMGFKTGETTTEYSLLGLGSWDNDVIEHFSIASVLWEILGHCKLDIIATSPKTVPSSITVAKKKPVK